MNTDELDAVAEDHPDRVRAVECDVRRDDDVEQGLLVGTTEYFAKSHVLKREYADEEHPFGWMQDGVFELFDREGRLYRWRTEDDLVDATEELP